MRSWLSPIHPLLIHQIARPHSHATRLYYLVARRLYQATRLHKQIARRLVPGDLSLVADRPSPVSCAPSVLPDLSPLSQVIRLAIPVKEAI